MSEKHKKYKNLALFCLPFLILALFFVVENLWILKKDFAIVDIKGYKIYAEVADSGPELARGLSGRAGLEQNHGMLFVMPADTAQIFWMKGMRFPIDILWVDNNRIVGWEKNVEVPTTDDLDSLKLYHSPEGVDHVLELPAGDIERLRIRLNDPINFQYER